MVLLAVMTGSGAELGPDELLRLRSERDPRPLPSGEVIRRRPGFVGPAGFGLDSVIRSDFPCNDDVIGGCPQRGPAVAVGPDGGFAVTWYGFREGDADVWLRRFDADAVPLGPAVRLNADTSMGWQGDPAVAVGADGRLFCTWEDRRVIGNSDVFAQRFDGGGNAQGGNFRVSDSGVPGDQSLSGCWTGPDGVTLVAWDDRRFGITGDIFAQLLDASGVPLDTNFRVNDDQVGQANQYEPVVGGDSSGRFVVAWMDGRGRNWKDWNVFCQRFGPTGERLGSNIQVTTDDSIQWVPGLAVAPSGRFLVCWEDQRTGEQSDVYARVFDADGTPLGPEFIVNGDGGNQSQASVTAAASSNGEFLVAWADRRAGDDDIYVQRLSSAGQKLGANRRVSDASTAGQITPHVAGGPRGGYVVAWVDVRTGDQDIYGQRLAGDGSLLGGNFRVNDDSASSQQRVSSVAATAFGTFLVAWEDERSGSADAYCVMLDSGGVPIGPNRRLNDDPGQAPQYYCAAAGGRDRGLVAWVDGRSGYDIYAQWLSGDGTLLGDNRRVNSDPGSAHQWYPFATMDTLDRSVIVWTDYRRSPNCEIYCRRFDSAGNALGDELRVADDSANQYYASVAAARGGRFAVTWMDYRDGNADIYVQAFRSDGTRVGGNRKVNDDAGTSYQGYPVVAVFEDGSFAVAWEETRNDRYDVYLQWFDSSATPVGENLMVNDWTGADCYSPSLSCDISGRLAVMFNDERDLPGVPQIYCQRFRPDRSRISGNQRVSEPSLFPKNSHWTVGQSVAASGNVLAFAWTDNRRRQGWDIFAKLTDWELVGIDEAGAEEAQSCRPAWPSVAVGRVRLAFPGAAPGRQVLLFDAAGRRVSATAAPGRDLVLDLGGLAAGVYTVVVRSTGASLHGRLVVR